MTQTLERPAAKATRVEDRPQVQHLQAYHQRLIEELQHVEREFRSLGGTVNAIAPDGLSR